jgi:hypothetical protein
VGAGPVGVVFSEYALAKPRAADLISPMLMQNGGWASYITTPRGRNHAFKLYQAAKLDPSWFCELQTLEDTRAYDPQETLAASAAVAALKPSSGKNISATGQPLTLEASGEIWWKLSSAGRQWLTFDSGRLMVSIQAGTSDTQTPPRFGSGD